MLLLQIIKGEFKVVQYVGWDTHYSEIVEPERLRHVNLNPTIDCNTFFKFEIEVPEELREHAKVEGVHKEFMKAIDASICRYIPERGVLTIISRSELSKKRASMMQDMHFRNISQKVLLLKRTEEAAKQLESTKLQTQSGYTIVFFLSNN